MALGFSDPKPRKYPVRRQHDHVRDAAQALSDLNVFAAVVALLESGLNHSPTFPSAEKIIDVAKAEQQRCLKRYDVARELANK